MKAKLLTTLLTLLTMTVSIPAATDSSGTAADGAFNGTDGVLQSGVARFNGEPPTAVPLESPTEEGAMKPRILWQNTAGNLAAWMFDGTNFSSSVPIESRDSQWKVIGSADINRDNHCDLLWLNEVTGRLEVSLMDGTNLVQTVYVRPAPLPSSGWKLLGVGDLNNDASPDLLWLRPAGQMVLWEMDGTRFVKASWFREGKTLNPEWRLAAIADFNGDSRNDLLWQNADGRVSFSIMNETGVESSQPLQNGQRYTTWKVAKAADFNNDSKPDLLWRHVDGRVAVWIMDGTQLAEVLPLRNGADISRKWRVIGAQ